MSVHNLQRCARLLLVALSGYSGFVCASELGRGDDESLAPILSSRAIATGESSHIWPAGVIPYSLDQTLPDSSIANIEAAIAQWNKVPGISLRPVEQSEQLSAFSTRDVVEFIVGDYCASWVGRRGGVQNVWVSEGCHTGGVLHEIGHLVGLEHEHTRVDRDQYIQIHWENIDADKQHNFDAAPAAARLLGEYDYASVMHYGTSNFSSNGLPTISRLDGSNEKIGQRSRLSIGDLAAVRTLYGTDLSVQVKLNDEQGELEIFVSNESIQGAQQVSVSVPRDQLSVTGYMPILSELWSCSEVVNAMVNCVLDRLPGSAVERLRLPLAVEPNGAGVRVTLDSHTPDFNLDNNVSHTAHAIAQITADNAPSFKEPLLVSALQLAESIDRKIPLQQDGSASVTTGFSNVALLWVLIVALLSRYWQTGGWVNLVLRLSFAHRIRKVGI